jgi:hypothetical protein
MGALPSSAEPRASPVPSNYDIFGMLINEKSPRTKVQKGKNQ